MKIEIIICTLADLLIDGVVVVWMGSYFARQLDHGLIPQSKNRYRAEEKLVFHSQR